MIASLLLLLNLGAQTLLASPSKDPDMFLTRETVEAILGSKFGALREHIGEDAMARGNTPASRPRHVTDRDALARGGTLWIDRDLDPQTIVHFLEFAVTGHLPSGEHTDLPTVGKDMILVTEPYSKWAPAPFHKHPRAAIEDVVERIGIRDDSSRPQIISKDLHAMKSRLWHGVMPLSQRRLDEKGAADLRNFSFTSQLVTQVINVFHYLNEPEVHAALRDTYNLVWDHFETFENALNAKRAQESQPNVSVTALWAEFMRSHHEVMENRAHSWVLQILRPLKEQVMAELRRHQPDQLMTADYDKTQWKLTNMWQDLSENTAQADWSIFVPMDGYKGCASSSATPRNMTDETSPPSGAGPIAFSPDPDRRMRDYHSRRRDFNMMASTKQAIEGAGSPNLPFNHPDTIVPTCVWQSKAQAGARRELRGNSITYKTESWLKKVARNSGWGYVVYKTSQAHSDAQWSKFIEEFEADAGNWGQGLVDIDKFRSQSNMHWIDGKDVGTSHPSLEDLKRHFSTYAESASFPKNCFADMFLVADEASVTSYLTTAPQASLLSGDIGPFIKAVDASFDPDLRPDAMPGFDGALRVLGSLVWDDVGALAITGAQDLVDLWPLAVNHPLQVYIGPVVEAQTEVWKKLRKTDKQDLERWIKVRRSEKAIHDEL